MRSSEARSEMGQRKTEDCEVCKFIRWYLMLGIPAIALMWTQPELNFLQGVDATKILSSFFTLALIAVVAWKYYDEFGRK